MQKSKPGGTGEEEPYGEGSTHIVMPLGEEGTVLGSYLIRYPFSYRDDLIRTLQGACDGTAVESGLSIPEFLYTGDDVSQSLLQMVLSGQSDDTPILEIVRRHEGRNLYQHNCIHPETGKMLDFETIFKNKVELMVALNTTQAESLERILWGAFFIAHQPYSQTSPDFNDGTFMVQDDLSLSMTDVVGQESLSRQGVRHAPRHIEELMSQLDALSDDHKPSLMSPLRAAFRMVTKRKKPWQKILVGALSPVLVPLVLTARSMLRRGLKKEISDAWAVYAPKQTEQDRGKHYRKKQYDEKIRFYLNNGVSGILDVLDNHITSAVPDSCIDRQAKELETLFLDSVSDDRKPTIKQNFSNFYAQSGLEDELTALIDQTHSVVTGSLKAGLDQAEFESAYNQTEYATYVAARQSFDEQTDKIIEEIMRSLNEGNFEEEVHKRYPRWKGFQRAIIDPSNGEGAIKFEASRPFTKAQLSTGEIRDRKIEIVGLNDDIESFEATLQAVGQVAIPTQDGVNTELQLSAHKSRRSSPRRPNL